MSGWLRCTEFALLAAGASCAFIISGAALSSVRSEKQAQNFGVAALEAQRSDVRHTPVDTQAQGSAQSYVMGRLEIPQVGISVPILSNFQTSSLLKGVGHVPGTAMPGGLGTLGLAGHRDTYFRPLKNIQKDMDIRVADKDGVYHYKVDFTEVVTPDDVEVLDVRNQPELTLITCYPFYYAGAAPKRFIVHAHLVSALPDIR